MDAAFGAGGLAEGFKEFARLTMDVEPEKGIFIDVSGPIELYSHHYDQLIELEKGQEETPVDLNLDPLSAVYVRVYNFLDPKQTPHVRFNLSQLARNPDLTVQAVIDPGEKNKKEDWTGLEERAFCINWEEDRFSAIELVVASKSTTQTHSSGFVVTADDKGCSEGRLIVTYNIDNTMTSFIEEKSDQTITINKENHYEKTNAVMLYELEWSTNDTLDDYGPVRWERYRLHSVLSSSGTGNWERVFDIKDPPYAKGRKVESLIEIKLSGVLDSITEPDIVSVYFDQKTGRPLKVHFITGLPIGGWFSWKGETRVIETRGSETKTYTHTEEIKAHPHIEPWPIPLDEILKQEKVVSCDDEGKRFSGIFRWDTTAAGKFHFKGSASWDMVRKSSK